MESVIEQSKKNAVQGMERLLKTFSFVPDDKLEWTPSATSKSALRIVAHCGISNETFAYMIREGSFPATDRNEVFTTLARREQEIHTREEAIRVVRETTDQVLAALDALTPDRVASTVETPGVNAPMMFFMFLPGRHCEGHAAQIDYLQTCWGDLDPHF